MLAHVEKGKSREAVLLARQTAAITRSWAQFVQGARAAPGVAAALARRDVEAALRALDRPIQAFASGWVAAFIDTGNLTAAHLSRKLTVRKATPTVGLSFDVVDPKAVALMRQNRLYWVRRLTDTQRTATRQALVQGLRRGEGPVAMARRFRNSIGLLPQQQESLDAFERAQRTGREDELLLPEAERVISSDRDIERLMEVKAKQLLTARAEAIARTESTRIVGLAQDQALRQSITSVGQSASLTGKIWRSTHDGRTRDAHVDRDGTRLRLDEEFAPGIQKPGDGPPKESIQCRCVLEYFFADSEAEMQEWLSQ